MEKDSKMENNPPEKCSTKDLRNGKSRLGVTFPRYDRDGQRIPDGDQCKV